MVEDMRESRIGCCRKRYKESETLQLYVDWIVEQNIACWVVDEIEVPAAFGD